MAIHMPKDLKYFVSESVCTGRYAHEMDDWPTAPLLPAHINWLSGYRDGGP
jgi:hypothetical protein